MTDIKDVCSNRPKRRRIDDWQLMRQVADIAEHASIEDFIEQVLPEFNGYTVSQLWVLVGMLHDGGQRDLARFVGYYAQQAETSIALALQDDEADHSEHPWDGRLLCDYMPSPLRSWGDWRAQQARRAVQAEIAKTSTASLSAFLYNWNPTKPS
jgi:hypothetical protein